MITYRQLEIEKKFTRFTMRIFPWLCIAWIGYTAHVIIKQGVYYQLIYILLYTIGLVFSLLLSARMFGLYSHLTSQFCGKGGQNMDCDAVIASRGGYLCGGITWSDVGNIFFIYALLSGGIFLKDNQFLYILTSWLAFPYVLYSLYYQKYVAHHWCLLCLAVQIVLLLLFGWSCWLMYNKPVVIEINNAVFRILLLLTLVFVYLIVKHFFKVYLQYQQLERQFAAFKTQQRITAFYVSEKIDLPSTFVFHPAAPNRITVVIRLGCTPCIYHLNEIIAAIEQYSDIAVEFVFHTTEKHLRQELPLMLYFITLYYAEGALSFLKSLKQYVADYPLSSNIFVSRWDSNREILPEVEKTLKQHIVWCSNHHIVATPVYLLNGRCINHYYSFEDLLATLKENPTF